MSTPNAQNDFSSADVIPYKNFSSVLPGLYIHIPFCKKACHYCDFHFSTSLDLKNALIEAICQEIVLQKNYLSSNSLQTIYFGGGTPSLLNEADFDQLFNTVHTCFTVAPDAEITLEANPDDLSKQKIEMLSKLPVNRLSIGIQSFYEPHLQYLNRAHTAVEASNCVQITQDAGFDNISIDLIYAIPHPNHAVWENDLQTALQLQVQHISSYCLTIEPRTVFGKWVQTGKIPPIDEEFSVQQFQMLIETLQRGGFEQYEISNFALPGYYSIHNSNYWKKKHYLGVGPSAHSFNGTTRQYNIANNNNYIKALTAGEIPYTIENLSINDQVNEYIMTSLRTKWGCNLQELAQWSGIDVARLNQSYITGCLQKNLVTLNAGILQLTPAGKLLADQIASDLFIV
jgi:oxygen-independent coproporphyrinogen-3 oxidase